MADLSSEGSLAPSQTVVFPHTGGADGAVVTMRNSAKAAHSHAAAEPSNVKVMVRVRPFNTRELNLDKNPKSVIFMKDNVVTVLTPEGESKEAFAFDSAFWSIPEAQKQPTGQLFASQEHVFGVLGQPMVDACVAGYNCTILAYGQTGSGKTYSMLGTPQDAGVSPQLVRRLFEQLKFITDSTNGVVQCSVQMSFLEIYNEKVQDLLLMTKKEVEEQQACLSPQNTMLASAMSMASFAPDPIAATQYKECRVRFSHEFGTFVEGLTREEITTEEQCQRLIRQGVEHRAVAETKMNATSSRSHAIFQLCVRQKDAIRGTQKISVVNLVDLAGSERIKLSGVTGKALTEAKNINLSLTTLRRVIDVLLENSMKKGKGKGVPPYRESLLTWLLADSLGGNSRTALLATVSPFVGNLEDTMGTLRYALKAKAIVCAVRVNEEKTTVVMAAIRDEMDTLKKRLSTQLAEGNADTAAAILLRTEIASKEGEFRQIEDEQKQMAVRRTQLQAEISKHDAALEKLNDYLNPKLKVWEETRALQEELERMKQLREQQAKATADEEALEKHRAQQIQYEMQRRGSLIRRQEELKETTRLQQLRELELRQAQWKGIFDAATQLTKDRREMVRLTDYVGQLQQRQEVAEATLRSLQPRIDRESTEVLDEGNKATSLERAWSDLSREVGDVVETKTDRIKTLVAKRKAADEALKAARVTVATVVGDIAALEAQREKFLTDAHRQSLSIDEEHNGGLDRLEELRTEVNRAEDDHSLLEGQCARADHLKSKSDGALTDLVCSNETLDIALASLTAECAALELQCIELAAAGATAEEDATACATRNAALRRDAVAVLESHGKLKDFVTKHYYPAPVDGGSEATLTAPAPSGRARSPTPRAAPTFHIPSPKLETRPRPITHPENMLPPIVGRGMSRSPSPNKVRMSVSPNRIAVSPSRRVPSPPATRPVVVSSRVAASPNGKVKFSANSGLRRE